MSTAHETDPHASVPALHAVEPSQFAAQFAAHDALVLLCAAPLGPSLDALALPPAVREALSAALAVDAGLARGATRPPVVLAVPAAPGGRVVLATLGALTEDTDDVRLVSEAAFLAAQRALDAGARAPLAALSVPDEARYANARVVAAAALLGSQWHAVEAREAHKVSARLERVSFVGLTAEQASYARALEVGRYLARDITGTEPERMAPARVAELCARAFAGTSVRVSVEHDVRAYPLLTAVARASMVVERHRPCVVRLEYAPANGVFERTLYLAGKGVTYDTGGADVKTDGSMAGMSRDKGGAGSVAGLVRTIAELAPAGVRVVALLGMVRNSIGEESFVSDEVIPSRAGVRVRIGNTDAEGRLVLADLLAALGDEARAEGDERAKRAVLVSVATLTGHVYRAFGPYAGAIENGAGRAAGVVRALSECGERWGEPFESTRVRREDYAFVAPRSNAEDVVSSNRLASVSTPRGHQGPFAFLDVASGLKNSGIAYAHVDMGGVVASPVDWQFGRPTGAVVAALAAWWLGR